MTKSQLIERYGIEWYELHKQHCRLYYNNNEEYRSTKKLQDKERNNMKYNTDLEFKHSHKQRMRTYSEQWRKQRYVKDGRYDLIENYELAKAANFKGWDIHHKLEIHEDYVNTYKDLMLMNLYYNRPPEELIWLTRSEHMKLHNNNSINIYRG